MATVLGEFPRPIVNKVLGAIDNAPSDLQADIAMALASSSEGKDIIFQQVRSGAIRARTLIEPKVEERIFLNISAEQQKEFEELTANLEPVSKEKQALIAARLEAFNASSEQSGSVEFGRKVLYSTVVPAIKSGMKEA